MWAKGRVQVLQEFKRSILMEDSGNPGPQSEGTPQITPLLSVLGVLGVKLAL